MSNVKARQDKMIGLVETMMTADSLQPTAYGPDGMCPDCLIAER